MTRAETIARNDELRCNFKGGRIEVWHGPFEIDDRLIGRMLYVLSRYRKFDDDSLHDAGLFIFGGFSFEWLIEEVNGELGLCVWVEQDALLNTAQ